MGVVGLGVTSENKPWTPDFVLAHP
jgi:hypothetical protein